VSFDDKTRSALSAMVVTCRRHLKEDVTDQLQKKFGMYPDGTTIPIAQLDLAEDAKSTAEALRELFEHFAVGEAGRADERPRRAFARLVLEISFTALNRLAALRLCEERGLVIECVRRGTASDGFRVFENVSGGALGTRYETYRVFLDGIFDELARDLGVLFDRTTPQSALFPSERCLGEVLAELNEPALGHLWAADEMIGWIYQYFNPEEERAAMRKASAAPANSRELAVRNQFFTPRYVVEFLVDNTLGRIWYDMHAGNTSLKDECRYLLRRPNEVFLGPEEDAPEPEAPVGDLSQQEVLKQRTFIAFREKKDPRDLRLLDPACGSGHFLLYAFDLLERIYEEAWHDPHSPKSERTGRALRDDFDSVEALKRAVPKAIVEFNLHGIDIDARAVQIAALALWLRAQKRWKALGHKAGERPRIERSNLVTAEPMPGEEDMRAEFTAALKPRVLGQLVDAVFDKMKLAADAGPLLKLEKDISDSVASAKHQWLVGPKPEQTVLFPEILERRPEQQALFDVQGVTDEQFWEQAENLILDALKRYAEEAENHRGTVRRRLFAQDASHGFAFIELCRNRYDVVLMNPPFGSFSKVWTANDIKIAYPDSSNDILAAFVDRFLSLLIPSGRLGAITSRTCFFLSTFKDWRRNVVLQGSAIRAIADLGQGVMDNAMVEAAAYVLERTLPTSSTVVFRAIADTARQQALEDCIDAYRNASLERRLFLAEQAAFDLLPDSPFVYWIDGKTIRQFKTGRTFEPNVGSVRVGVQTGDDPRYVRAVWEVPYESTIFCYYPQDGTNICRLDDPLVVTHRRRKERMAGRWAFFVKAGASQPWYSPVTLKLNWARDGHELKNFRNSQGKPRAFLRSKEHYYRPGFSWTRRAVRFYPYIVPTGCIPSVSRYMGFPDHGLEAEAVGVCASRVVSSFLRFYAEFWQRPNFLVDTVKGVPWPDLPVDAKARFDALVARQVEQRRVAYQNHEPFHEFLLPVKIRDFSQDGRALAFEPASLIDEATERLVSDGYGLTEEQTCVVERDLLEAIAYQRGTSTATDSHDSGDTPGDETGEESASDESSDFVLDYSLPATEEAHISYLVGVIFGRWDVRIALDPSLAPKLPHPFSPLPVCPPGMLVNPVALPAESGLIASVEWLRARLDANTLPAEGSVKSPPVADEDYPVRVSWDGILVDDPGLNGGQPHRDDIVRRVTEVLDLLWNGKAEQVEQQACEHLGVKELRDYFRRPSGFFQQHLKRYTKTRKAPIYWPLSTASGKYTIWIYYHRLSEQTLYAVVNKYVDPKITEVQNAAVRIEKAIETSSGGAAAQLRDDLNDARAFLGELRELRTELMRIAALPYRPNLDDGVMINAAPFHKLFRLRSWAEGTEDTWKKLEGGDYSWAHLAYTVWPDTVKAVCRNDRSVAIAHGLEELCEIERPDAERSGKRKGRTAKKVAR
jgi:hypothetical protein